MTIKHLASRLAHQFNGGAIALAAMMDKSPKVLQNKLNPNSETHYLTIAEFEMMADMANGNLTVAKFFADKANAIVFKLPDAPEMSDMELLDSFMNIMAELGRLSSEFQRDYADGVIDEVESQRIKKAVDDVMAKLFEFQAVVQRVAQ